MEKLLNDFLYYNEVILGKSPNTIRSYKNDLSQLIEYLGNNEGIVSFNEVELMTLRSYIAYLSYSKKSSKRTINRKISAIRSFFDYLVSVDKLEENIAIYVNTPKFENKLPNYLTKEDMEKLREVISLDSIIGLRDRAIIELLYSSGLRSFELLDLVETTIDFKNRELRVIGKGNKERITFFSVTAKKYLEEYIGVKKANNKYNKDILFSNARGGKLTTRSLRRIIEAYSLKSGIQKEVSPHTFRHSFATELLNSGVDIRYVQELLGHQSIATTQFYTHVSKKKLRDMYLKTHPFANEE
ncbi:site-specific tyrosine recombinase/integron integrase [Oceanivirga miroungae]|uniref:Tyrosine recombinase XerC n=1 Tax=Oceanivirga miroungae TaxID=1130046 RepID=A0A6I8MBX0_9FUSO|nr:site-specific tyrosine recombinase/integron integrase [Oceanivirga miroungae]VWL85728.1 Type 1 fimbriae Regulatory protein fimE [Oceanivirga miroungae]